MKNLRRHPMYSVDILEPLSSIDMLIDSIKYHHERYDAKDTLPGRRVRKYRLKPDFICGGCL